VHRWGVFAEEAIPARRRVIEYTGERIDRREAHRRRLRPYAYFFATSKTRAIDGAIGGSGAEFINHSCEPNLLARVRGGRVFYVSRRRIEPGEELLLDYGMRSAVSRTPCRCGSVRCRGVLERPPLVADGNGEPSPTM
jgi:SET domain-containing protein